MGAVQQSLNQRLSELLNDEVDTYDIDGDPYSSADRDGLINSASKFLFNAFYDWYRLLIRKNRGETHIDIRQGIDLLNDFLKSTHLSTASFSGIEEDGGTDLGLDISGINRLKEILFVNGALDSDSGEVIKNYAILSPHEIILDFENVLPKYKLSQWNPHCWITKDGSGKAIIRIRRTGTTAGVPFRITYLQYPNDSLRSADSEDIQWRSEFQDTILNIAKAYAYRNNGDDQAYINEINFALSIYNISPALIKSSANTEEQIKAQL
jgi:hypothetical protein